MLRIELSVLSCQRMDVWSTLTCHRLRRAEDGGLEAIGEDTQPQNERRVDEVAGHICSDPLVVVSKIGDEHDGGGCVVRDSKAWSFAPVPISLCLCDLASTLRCRADLYIEAEMRAHHRPDVVVDGVESVCGSRAPQKHGLDRLSRRDHVEAHSILCRDGSGKPVTRDMIPSTSTVTSFRVCHLGKGCKGSSNR